MSFFVWFLCVVFFCYSVYFHLTLGKINYAYVKFFLFHENLHLETKYQFAWQYFSILYNLLKLVHIICHQFMHSLEKKLKFKSYIELIFIIIRLKQFTLLYKLLRIHTSYIPFCFMLQAICKHSFFNNSSTSCNFNLF